MVIENSHIIAILLALCLSQTARAAISPVDKTYTASVGTDLTIPWSFDNEADMSTVFWSHKTTATPVTVMSKTGTNAAVVFNNFHIQHVSNGEVKFAPVKMENEGIYYCEVSYSLLSGHPSVTGTATVSIVDCTCECKCKCKRIVIPSIVFGSLGMINLPVVIGGTVTEQFGRTTALVVDSIGIVCDVLSSVLGIVVQIIDCCEDCCEDSDCCECERNWIENTGAAFIAIGALVGIVAGTIFYLIWSNRMGPGNNAYKAKEAKEPGENHGMTGTSM